MARRSPLARRTTNATPGPSARARLAVLAAAIASCGPQAPRTPPPQATEAVEGRNGALTESENGTFPDPETARRCPQAPQGDAAAHLALVEKARRDPSPENLARLDDDSWTELWAVAARMGAEAADDDWPSACERHEDEDGVVRDVSCRQHHWGTADAARAVPDASKVACTICFVGDLAPLGAQAKLTTLFLSDTFIEHPESLGALHRLEALTLQNTNVTSARALAPLSALKRLTLTGPFIHDLTGVEKLSALADLTVGGRCLLDVAPLRGLSQMVRLFLQGWEVRDLRPLETLTGLRDLIVWAPHADGAPSFAAMKQLRSLSWRGRALVKLDDLRDLPELAEVHLDFHCVPEAGIDAFRIARPEVDLVADRRHPDCPR